ncbi:MAG: hypothetical protein AMXMBFR34_48660 [Myxococcaceae bacterium]
MTTNARAGLWLSVLVLVGACGPGVLEEGEDLGPEEYVGDDGTGDEVATVDPMPSGCVEEPCDEVPVEVDGGEEEDVGLPGEDAGPGTAGDDGGAPADAVEPGAGGGDGGLNSGTNAGQSGPARDGGVDAGAGTDAGAPRPDGGGTTTPVSPWRVGAKILVRGYVTFRSAASSTASALTTVDPNGGVTDSAHGGGMPRGQLPPGQVVTLAHATKTNGFYQVTYDGRTGWLPASWLLPVDGTKHPVDFALGGSARNAFFKHQLRRSKWNKDGPLSSSTCAPTSLAMAARVFGKEPRGLSIEESIHRSRQSYGATSDGTGTFRSQITRGATALGLKVRVLDTRLSLSSMLTRIDQQLAAKRVVVLEGQPGLESAGATAYQRAFNRAYAAAGVTRTYTFDGRHSIVVLGKDAAGKYVVGDPISEVGMLALTGAELKDFFARWGGTGNAVWAP